MPIQSISGLAQAIQSGNFGNRQAVAGDQAVGSGQDIAAQSSVSQLKNVVDDINKALKQSNSILEFNMDAETRKLTVKLVDRETGDVIRQFPSQDMLAISHSIERIQQGLLLKQQA